MWSDTYYAVKPFFMTEDGIQEGETFLVPCAAAGLRYADKLNDRLVGIIVFSRSMSLMFNGWNPAIILGVFGEVPEDAF